MDTASKKPSKLRMVSGIWKNIFFPGAFPRQHKKTGTPPRPFFGDFLLFALLYRL